VRRGQKGKETKGGSGRDAAGTGIFHDGRAACGWRRDAAAINIGDIHSASVVETFSGIRPKRSC